jgi:hypothetical protein
MDVYERTQVAFFLLTHAFIVPGDRLTDWNRILKSRPIPVGHPEVPQQGSSPPVRFVGAGGVMGPPSPEIAPTAS